MDWSEAPSYTFTAVVRFVIPQNLGLDLCPGEGAMLEVILQNAGGQGWADRALLSFHRAHDFSAADDFRLRKSRNFRREHQIDFEL